MSGEGLKACPFCGVIPTENITFGMRSVIHELNDCLLRGTINRFEKWQDRPTPDAALRLAAQDVYKWWRDCGIKTFGTGGYGNGLFENLADRLAHPRSQEGA